MSDHQERTESRCGWCDLPAVGWEENGEGTWRSCGGDNHGFAGTFVPDPGWLARLREEAEAHQFDYLTVLRQRDQARAEVARLTATLESVYFDHPDYRRDRS